MPGRTRRTPRNDAIRRKCYGTSIRANAYIGRASRSAQAAATAELGVSAPGAVAQPPFSMINRRSQVEALLNSVSFAGASACCRNLSTQIGVSTSTTAVCARSLAVRSAVPPNVRPKIEKPSTDMSAAPITAPQMPGLKPEGSFIDLISCAPVGNPIGSLSMISEVLLPGTIRATTYTREIHLEARMKERFRRRPNGAQHAAKAPSGTGTEDESRARWLHRNAGPGEWRQADALWPFSSQCRAGNVKIRRASWNEERRCHV